MAEKYSSDYFSKYQRERRAVTYLPPMERHKLEQDAKRYGISESKMLAEIVNKHYTAKK